MTLISTIHIGRLLFEVHTGRKTLDKELEFYELLDLDADGEYDIDVDNTTEQVLGFDFQLYGIYSILLYRTQHHQY